MSEVVYFHIDYSPGKKQNVCQNCIHFSKWGVHLGTCIKKKSEKLDYQKCNKFERLKY